MKVVLPNSSIMQRKEFTFGAATSAFQIEGAVQQDGRCESIWDRFCRTPGKVKHGDLGDVACRHYDLYDQDLDLLKELNFDAYRFSIAWPRIEPEKGFWNSKGFDFYQRLVDGLLERGIEPHVTLYHWDLPQYYEDLGGWLNRETCFRFAEYADKVTDKLGDRVASYATFNEPWCSAFLGYRDGVHAPGLENRQMGFQAAHHLLLAHGLALPKMRANAPEAKHGIVLNFTPAFAATDKPEDVQAAEFSDAENTHWFIQPLMEGQYPEQVEQTLAAHMPVMEADDLATMNQPIDFLGINYYTRAVVAHCDEKIYQGVTQPEAEHTAIGWEIYPQGLTHLLTDLHQRYELPPIYITENGAAGLDKVEAGEVNDEQRCRYFQGHLAALNDAIDQGVNVEGYFAWSLLDNFEWAEGYEQRFGIVHVDFETQVRTPKRSALMLKEFINQRS